MRLLTFCSSKESACTHVTRRHPYSVNQTYIRPSRNDDVGLASFLVSLPEPFLHAPHGFNLFHSIPFHTLISFLPRSLLSLSSPTSPTSPTSPSSLFYLLSLTKGIVRWVTRKWLPKAQKETAGCN